jgi:hypothetical protein
VNLLCSYAHIAKAKRWVPLLELWASRGLPLLIDSGAFTAMKTGLVVDHAAYIMFVKQLQSCGPNVEAISLDVIRDPAATMANLVREYTDGLKTIPVLTHNATVEDFANLATKFNPRVCVAGAVQNGAEWATARIQACHSRVGGAAQIHALGWSNEWAPLRSKAFSFDSTSWIAALKYGVCFVYDPIKGKVRFDYRDVVNLKLEQGPKELRTTLLTSGITEKEWKGPEGGKTPRSIISFITAATWLKWANKVERNGQRFFFAGVAPFMLSQLMLGAIHGTRTGINWRSMRPEIVPLQDALLKDTGDMRLIEETLDRAVAVWKASLV